MDRDITFFGDSGTSQDAFGVDLSRAFQNASKAYGNDAKIRFEAILNFADSETDTELRNMATGTSARPPWGWSPGGIPIYRTPRPWLAYIVEVDNSVSPPLATVHCLALADENADEQTFWRLVLGRCARL